MLIRKPHVAGTFYPADPGELKSYCDQNLGTASQTLRAKAIVLPHAGYMYSGETACRVLQTPHIPDHVLLIGPNHSGMGPAFSVMTEGEWMTPLGGVPIASKMARELAAQCPDMREDSEAHLFEHCLEVEIPFLQTLNPSLSIIPMVVGTHDLVSAEQVARCCGRWIASRDEDILVVISTDMSHYESDEVTRHKDQHALEAIGNLDAEALAEAVRKYRVTMCGFVPVYMLLRMKELLGIKKAELVQYTTSADASGDYERVVGYAGFILQ